MSLTTRQCMQLARRQLERLDKQLAHYAEQDAAALRTQLELADAKKVEEPAVARQIWQAIIALYADHPWAADFVARSRRELAEPDRPGPPEPRG
jgi:hypothetical protein